MFSQLTSILQKKHPDYDFHNIDGQPYIDVVKHQSYWVLTIHETYIIEHTLSKIYISPNDPSWFATVDEIIETFSLKDHYAMKSHR